MAKRKPRSQVEGPSPPETRPPLKVVRTTRFQKEVEIQKKRGKDMVKLRAMIELLSQHKPLEPSHRDHSLGGGLKGWRGCHIEPDWVLNYRKDGDELRLGGTGTHSDLFGK